MLKNLHIDSALLIGSAVILMDACAAFALAIFLIKRWRKLNGAMRAYTFFWLLTFFTWLPDGLRYFLLSIGQNNDLAHFFDFITQAAIFLSGVPLFYYLWNRIIPKQKIGEIFAIISGILGIIGIALMLQPDGLVAEPVTQFSIDTMPAPIPLFIFNSQAGLIVLLLIVDFFKQLKKYRLGQTKLPYEIYYPLIVFCYLLLGMIDQSGLVNNWMLIAVRALYAATFLGVYLVIIQHEAVKERFLTEFGTVDQGSININTR